MAEKPKTKFKEPKMSDRGFASFDPVSDLSGSNRVKVFESSNAEHAAVWLSIECDPSFTDPGGINAAAQVDLETLALIHQQIGWFLKSHYQLPPSTDPGPIG